MTNKLTKPLFKRVQQGWGVFVGPYRHLVLVRESFKRVCKDYLKYYGEK